ncbi:MAG TPA: OmpH family outer membrane protein [Syntrophales bacterium]|nr:OmpH family outer membrane protein [Syntrophales bacterium]
MKKNDLMIFTLMIVLVIFLYGSYASAAEKIGFIDMRKIMLNSDAGKRATAELAKLYEKDKGQIQAKEAELKKLKEELDKQRAVLTETAMKEKEATYQKKFRDYQLQVKDANDEMQIRDQELSKKLIPEILKVVKAIGNKEKCTVIIDISSTPIPYYSEESDLTDRVIQEFNITYKPKN